LTGFNKKVVVLLSHAPTLPPTRQLVEAVADVGAPVPRQHQQRLHVLPAEEEGLMVLVGVVVELEELNEVEADVEVYR
jgi:hypothetical protein